ncbi:MAG TPA: patatin-like phospholipase family protein [Rudaea sp.]|jgi:NTE family protein|nr:patatin-like phospholipase family protein [Rudaea sp.]
MLRVAAMVALLLLLTPMISHASEVPIHRPKTCLVLGGGGARGAAHIGVLKVIEQNHIPIDCITGTSMGAIVGGMYAAGYSAGEIEGILRSIDWKDMFSDDPARRDLPMRRKEDELRFLGGIELGLRDGKIALPRGVIQGQKLQLLLRRLLLSTLHTEHFDDLPIQFRSVATDIGSGEAVVFEDGDLAMAIRASMSVPAAFAPIRYRGHLLVDGGITDNVPIDVARSLGAQRLIVVDVSEPLSPEDKLDSPFSIANQMLTAMMKRQSDEQIARLGADDILLRPDLGDLTSTEFPRSMEAVGIGERTALADIDKLRRDAVSDADYSHFASVHHPVAFDPPLVQFLDVLRTRSRTAGYVEQNLTGLTGKPFDAEKLDEKIGKAYGEGSYERISYDVEKRGDEEGLVVIPVDKSWGPNFLRFGLRLSDNFDGRNSYQLITEANFTGLNDYGGESRNRVQLGQITELYSEYLQPFGNRGEFYVAPYLQYKAYNFPINEGEKIDFAEYRRSRADVALETGWTPSTSWQLSGALEYGRDTARLRIGQPDFPDVASTFGGIVLRAVYDDLNASGFPTRGTRVDVSQELLLSQLGSTSTAQIARGRWDTALSYGPNTFLFGGSISSSTGNGREEQLAAFSPLGGLTNLSGYTENQLFATQTALARGIYYRRLTDAQSLFSVPVYFGGSLEAGGVWDTRRAIGSSPIAAGSLFLGIDTFLGPMFLGYGYAQGGHNALYLTFGSLLRTDQ